MADPMSVEERVARLEAIEEVRATMARYVRAVDEDGLGALAAVLAPEVVLRNPTAHEGRDAVLAYYRTFFESGVTVSRHHTANVVVELESPDRARFSAYFLVLIGRGGRSYVGWGNYRDVLERRAGHWLIVEKVNDVHGLAPLEEGWAAAGAPARLWGDSA
jgi:ketosteroid isomerase-like protein